MYERMRVEGRVIWERSCRLNQQGTERGGDFQTSTGLLLFGRKKRFRLVRRLVQKTRTKPVGAEEQGSKRKKQEEERRIRARLLSMGVRMVRRPWKATTRSWRMKTAQTIMHMEHSEIRKLVRTIYGGMRQIRRNIAMTNLKKIMVRRKDVVMRTV